MKELEGRIVKKIYRTSPHEIIIHTHDGKKFSLNNFNSDLKKVFIDPIEGEKK